MLYFIPGWYLNNEWKEDEQVWYVRRVRPEVDDTVKQVQLFQRHDVCEYKLLILGHTPNLRHFLHRQGVFRAPRWSVFDAIQEVRRSSHRVLSFHNLNWPKEIEFIYSQFAVYAMLHGEKYAQIEFGEYSNPVRVDLYSAGQLRRKNIYDDRGFLSCTIVYADGKKAYEEYLSEEGVWKICRFADGHVAVNPKSACYILPTAEGIRKIPFLKSNYPSMEEVIEEVCLSYMETTCPSDVFCAAVHSQHAALLERILAGRRKIFSVFEDRAPLAGDSDMLRLLAQADYIVADSEDNLKLLEQEPALRGRWMVSIPPYDTRVDAGISLQLSVQNILVPVDRLTETELEDIVVALVGYLKRNADARICLFTRNAAYGREELILEQVGRILEKHGHPSAWARKESTNRSENRLEEKEQLPILFTVRQCMDELSTDKCVREQRVLLDLAKIPDLFLQILCVSFGIPQLLRARNRYMIPGKNGNLVRGLPELEECLAYYLENLTNWNQAMVCSYELGKNHTAEALGRQWKEVIRYIEEDKSFTARGNGFEQADADGGVC